MSIEIRRRVASLTSHFISDLPPLLKRMYSSRGVLNDQDLDLSLDRLLPVSSLQGVDAAAILLSKHRERGRVLIVGDFDADGATSTALMVRALRSLGFAQVDFLVPNRFRYGYGLTPEIVRLAATRQPTLLVTVDNGVSSIEGVAAAHALGIPVLVTDHHLPGTTLPDAECMVNPNLRGATFASAALAGVGVTFYVVAALARLLEVKTFRAADLLDLVALGTVADVVPLDRNNRVLVEQGLRRIRVQRCVPGIRALLELGFRKIDQACAADLGFAVAPRLNAAGRLDDMSIGIECLLADDPKQALRLAGVLTQLNEERRDIEKRMQGEAINIAAGIRFSESGEESYGLCLFDAGWHQGIVGLVAGRIKDRLHRPVVAFARNADGSLRGSARSTSGVNIRDALERISVRYPGLVDKFGGHAMAAGLTLQESNLTVFRQAFSEEIAARSGPESLLGVIYSDGELSPHELSIDTARLLRAAGPWGQGFPEPIFDGEFSVVDARIVGEKHLKLRVRCASDGVVLDAIAFGYLGGGMENSLIRAGKTVRLAYRLEVNEYLGQERIQLNCQHVQLA